MLHPLRTLNRVLLLHQVRTILSSLPTGGIPVHHVHVSPKFRSACTTGALVGFGAELADVSVVLKVVRVTDVVGQVDVVLALDIGAFAGVGRLTVDVTAAATTKFTWP